MFVIFENFGKNILELLAAVQGFLTQQAGRFRLEVNLDPVPFGPFSGNGRLQESTISSSWSVVATSRISPST